jgi:hypothetical protein
VIGIPCQRDDAGQFLATSPKSSPGTDSRRKRASPDVSEPTFELGFRYTAGDLENDGKGR